LVDREEVNRPDVVAEIAQCFADYDRALLANDVDGLDRWFWNDASVIRFGTAEELYGAEQIAAYRRSSRGWVKRGPLSRTTITTFGSHAATVCVEFDDSAGHGRQSQTWVRLSEGWKIVGAHVSIRSADTPSVPLGNQPEEKEVDP
jgi:hypothetical protein